MANFSAKINLAKIEGAFVTTIQGATATKNCICIPLDAPGVYNAQSGAIYYDIVAMERRTPSQYGDTHIIKRSLGKAEREAMTEEQRNAVPIIGDMKMLGQQQAAPAAPAVPIAPNVGECPF